MQTRTDKLAYIDALRGYAILMVIASHAFPMVHELPWTLKRFSNLGFYGVQLFFVVSCVTLARSWGRRSEPGVAEFLWRRFFRIAPAYFLAAAAYLLMRHQTAPNAMRVSTFLTFTNGWSPGQMPTVQNAWIGVPGGWSIEAEFAFYALFPLVMRLRGWRPAVIALLVSLPAAWLANAAARTAYLPTYGATATDQFAYYWLPNQAPVFLAGLVLFHVIGVLDRHPENPASLLVARHATAIVACAVLMLALLAVVPWPRIPAFGHLLIPSPLIAAGAFCSAACAMAINPPYMLVNRPIVWLGQASFSAYLIHFAIISGWEALLPAGAFSQTGIKAALAGSALFALVLVSTAVCARITYRMIELPGIRAGTRIWTHLNSQAGQA